MSAYVASPTRGSAPAPALPAWAKPPADAVVRRLSAEDQVLLTKLLTEPADFVDHPDFECKYIEQELFGGTAQLAGPRATRFVPAEPVAEGVNKRGRVPTLKHDEEELLFKRFNFARRQVAVQLQRWAGKRLTEPALRQLLAWGHRVLYARSTIVRVNLPLVLAMAKRTRLTGIDFNELISEGNMALLRSVEKFDCSRGFKFSTYSCRAILKSFSRVAMRASRYRSYFPTEYDANLERSDYAAERHKDVEDDCVDELKEILVRNLAELTEVEQTVIQERFALGLPLMDGKPPGKTLEEVGQLIGVTKERVRQIQNKALKKIRHTLEDRYLAA